MSDAGTQEARTDSPYYLHLTPAADWERQASADHYVPAAFEADGFIHFTIGERELLNVGNRYYSDDGREYVAVEVDPRRLRAPVRYEDPRRIYPHLHGPLNRDAVVSVRRVKRGNNGVFVSIEKASAAANTDAG